MEIKAQIGQANVYQVDSLVGHDVDMLIGLNLSENPSTRSSCLATRIDEKFIISAKSPSRDRLSQVPAA